MEKINVEIKETLSRIIEVECNSENEALEFVQSQYNDENIVLDSNDFIDVEVTICNENKND